MHYGELADIMSELLRLRDEAKKHAAEIAAKDFEIEQLKEDVWAARMGDVWEARMGDDL